MNFSKSPFPPQKARQKCFLVCNAHLDPVWLWPWEDGMVEAISTYRVAADFCEKFPDFVFNHNESVLYEWVERNDAPLFKRIQKLVKAGRWHIAGGSFLQPDMIGASGESIIRQFLVGKLYFQEKFGKEPTTAYNFDSFGHPQGMAQILAGCGFDSYIFCRPNRGVQALPVGSFRWRHASGMEVVARRSDDHYITQGEIGKSFAEGKWPHFYREEGDFLFLWGIGNHGGGPSRKEYAELRKLPRQFPDVEFIESTPEAFFKHTLAVRGREALPVIGADLGPVQEGCYTSMQRVKVRHRQLENLMHLTEKLAAVAWWEKKHPYPAADLAVAWKDILFAERWRRIA
jgi:alpha-mannosidase